MVDLVEIEGAGSSCAGPFQEVEINHGGLDAGNLDRSLDLAAVPLLTDPGIEKDPERKCEAEEWDLQ